MIDGTAATLALRNRALSVSVATTGTTSLAATATDYTRAAGSFVTDGFAVGMELLASGFATAGNNGYKIITAVSALSMTVTSLTAMAVETAGGNELLIVRLPEGRAFDNVTFTPTAGRPYVEEDFVPGPASLITFPARSGKVEEDGLYVLKLYGLSGTGVAAIRKTIDALKALFAPGTNLTAGSHTLTVRGNPAPFAGQILPQGDGRSLCVLTIPWRARSINAIAA